LYSSYSNSVMMGMENWEVGKVGAGRWWRSGCWKCSLDMVVVDCNAIVAYPITDGS